MDDLNQQISQILSDPQSMRRLQDMAAALGLSGAQEPSPPAESSPPGGADASALLNLLGGQPASGGISPEMLQMVTRLAPLLSQLNREDDSTRLLHALRPLLGPERQKKLDEAVKILQMMRLLPLLKDSGLVSGLLPGLL